MYKMFLAMLVVSQLTFANAIRLFIPAGYSQSPVLALANPIRGNAISITSNDCPFVPNFVNVQSLEKGWGYLKSSSPNNQPGYSHWQVVSGQERTFVAIQFAGNSSAGAYCTLYVEDGTIHL